MGILSPGHPQEPGGVTDLTSRLVQHWTESGHQVHVASDRRETPELIGERWAAAGVRAGLLQYVPFLYGRRGLSRYPEKVVDAAARHGIRSVVYVHEPWVPLTRPQWLITGPLQRIQLRRLVARVAASVTPVPAWQQLLTPPPQVQYVGSTLGPVPRDDGGATLRAPVVFSPFGAGLNWSWIAAAVRAIGASPGLIVLGATEAEARGHENVAQWIAPGWDWRGRLSATETLALLARAPLVLAPFIDGLTGRRTSAAAALSAGARLVSSTGPLFDPFFRESPVVLAGSAAEFADRALEQWRHPGTASDRTRRIEWYDRHLDPRMLDARLLQIVLGT